MQDFSAGFDANATIKYRQPGDFKDNVNWDTLYVDEAYHQLYTSKIQYDKDGRLGGFFKMGRIGKLRCYLGGDYTPDLEPIMKLIDPTVKMFTEYPSQGELLH